MSKWFRITLCLLALALPAAAIADAELVKMAQQDLIALGYDPGNIQGEMTTETIVAVSKFQAEHNMPVTGEVTPQLIGALRAARNQQAPAGAAAAPAATPAVAPVQMTPQQQQADLLARQQACLQEKYAAAQEKQKKKRGMMRLLSAVTRTSSQFGDGDLASTIGQTASDVYNVNATAEDLSAAAKDLGLTEEEMEACRNPQ